MLTEKKRKLNENQDEKMIKENKKDQENYKFDKRKIIYDTHVMLGHANPRTTYGYLKDQYFWETMREDTNDILQKCKECMLFNDKGRSRGIYPILVGDAFERIGIDLMGPFKVTDEGNKFIIVAIDYLTKYVELGVLKEKSALAVSDFIFQRIILRHGCPDKILSDNGREFKNEVVKKLCDKLKIEKKFSSPYRPQTNGLVERTNRTLIAIISKFIFERKLDWDKCMMDIQFQYNIRPQETLGFSPFELLYGRKPKLPGFLKNMDRHEHSDERVKRINYQQQEVMKRRRKIQQRNAKNLTI